MKIVPRKQRYSSDCGPTSIKMVADHFGLAVSRRKIEKLCGGWRRGGMTNAQLVRVFRKLGLTAQGRWNATFGDLGIKDSTTAIVVSWMLRGTVGHFSVVVRATKDAVWLAEPETGKIVRFPRLTFLRLWYDCEAPYPRTRGDIKLRWMALVRKSRMKR